MSYELEYQEHKNERGELTGCIQLRFSGSEGEIVKDKKKLESLFGKKLESIAYEVSDDRDCYMISKREWEALGPRIEGHFLVKGGPYFPEKTLLPGTTIYMSDESLFHSQFDSCLDPISRMRIRDEIEWRDRLNGF